MSSFDELRAEARRLVEKHGSVEAAARRASRVLGGKGVTPRTMQRRLASPGTEADAALHGEVGGPPIPPVAVPPEGFVIVQNNGTYDEHGKLRSQSIKTARDSGDEYVVPPDHFVKGESTFVDHDGRVRGKWIKTKKNAEAVQGLVDALQVAFASHVGGAPKIKAPKNLSSDILTIYNVPDLHFGMYSWKEETGQSYNTAVAEKVAEEGIAALLSRSEPSRQAVLLVPGDFFHQNDQKNITPGSGHRLDVDDGRWQRIYEAGLRLLTRLVDQVAQKHEEVEVVILPGNHDEDAAVTLRTALWLFFSRTPRVTVFRTPGLFWYRRFGKCLFGATHGHTVKPDRMGLLLAADRPQDWGNTEHRHFFFGHIHRDSVGDQGPVRVESFGTPAARDAWAHGSGYRSGRALNAITFHTDDGERARYRVPIRS